MWLCVKKKNMRKLFTLLILLPALSYSQAVYEHISRSSIYDFMDELANEKLIQINSVVKPYTRMFIAEKLQEAYAQKEKLDRRQIAEIEFYMKDYRLELEKNTRGMKPLNIFPGNDHLATTLNPLGIFYRDSVFAVSARPIWGIDYYSNSNGTAYHRWGGLEGFAYIGTHVGIYTSLRDNHESSIMSAPTYFNQRRAAPAKYPAGGGIDYSEARGGMMYSWKWGEIGIVKDHTEWGDNYHGANILSGRTPSFAQIKLHLAPARWFRFDYIHGWLVSEVVDSSRSYWDGDVYRTVFHNKFIAANLFTIIPVKGLNFSFGNSIVYSDLGVHAAYLVPFLFYKSVDHTLNATDSKGRAGQNSQMFFNISSRNIKHLHLFVSLFVDEFSISRISHSDEHNFLSWKGGFRLGNWPLKNLSLTGEYTYTLPMTYQHNISTTTFETNRYNLGSYMRDNSRDLYIALNYRPIRGLLFTASYNFSQHGDDVAYAGNTAADKVPVLKNITWQRSAIGLNVRYEALNNAYVFAGLTLSDTQGFDQNGLTAEYYLEKFTAEEFRGKLTTLNFGFNVGF